MLANIILNVVSLQLLLNQTAIISRTVSEQKCCQSLSNTVIMWLFIPTVIDISSTSAWGNYDPEVLRIVIHSIIHCGFFGIIYWWKVITASLRLHNSKERRRKVKIMYARKETSSLTVFDNVTSLCTMSDMFVYNVSCLCTMSQVCVHCQMFGYNVSCLCTVSHVCVQCTQVCVQCQMFVYNVSCLCTISHVCVQHLCYNALTTGTKEPARAKETHNKLFRGPG